MIIGGKDWDIARGVEHCGVDFAAFEMALHIGAGGGIEGVWLPTTETASALRTTLMSQMLNVLRSEIDSDCDRP